MHVSEFARRCTAVAVLGSIALAGCSRTESAVEQLAGPRSAPNGPRLGLIANGNINVCKITGPAGTYHFHVDVAGGGTYVLDPGADKAVVFDGTHAACWTSAYVTVNDATWTPGLTATVTVSEILLPANVQVDSIELAGGFGETEASVLSANSITINEGVFDIHTVKFFNAARPTVDCVAITAVQGTAMTPVQVMGSGGSGAPYTFSASGLPAGVTMATDGTISGTPTVNGTFDYTVTVTDKDGHTGSANCSVTVSPPPPPPPPVGNQGCTPGYWKQSQHFDSWVGSGYTTSQLIGTVFTIPASYALSGKPLANYTFLEALQGGGGSSISAKASIMLRAAVAGLLNAGKMNVSYAWTTAQIVASVNAALAGGNATTITNLGTQIDNFNNGQGGCPLN